MHSENEKLLTPKSLAGSEHGSQKQSKISYTRDFLLSFSELDKCKKLPAGFDASILSEFEDASYNAFERQRSVSGQYSQNPRRDYGSLPSKFESLSSYSHASTGRWDTRSSGSTDKDGDSQSDRESFVQDSGRHSLNQTRRVWQHAEHDGLLGSGVLPRPSGFTGTSVSNTRGNGHYQLSRSSDPYQPPRPYKPAPYLRKDGTDSFNDETFGSVECSSQDRAEEERKRRASFELMRKEQHKTLKEKQNLMPDNHKAKHNTDLMALLENLEAENTTRISSNKSDDPLAPPFSQNDSSRASSHLQVPSRPPVPPGFASAKIEKNIFMQSSSTSLASEDGSAFNDNNLSLDVTDNDQERRNHSMQPVHVNVQNSDIKGRHVLSVDGNENIVISQSGVEDPNHAVGFETVSRKGLSLQSVGAVWEDVVNDLANKEEAREAVNVAGHNHSTSILEKLFGSALSKEYSNPSAYVESQGVKADEEAWSPSVSESSKFAHFFLEEEKKPLEDFPSRDLLSLITNNEKTASHVSAVSTDKVLEQILPSLSSETDPTAELLAPCATPSMAAIPEQFFPSEKLNSSSAVLTCEDLEQFIMAEVKETDSTLQKDIQLGHGKPGGVKAGVNDLASQHLLSLLHKGTNSIDSMPFVSMDASLSLGVDTFQNSEAVHTCDKSLTLEALFGAAFMNELHSVEAPLSLKKGSADEFSSTTSEFRPNQIIRDPNFEASSQNDRNAPGPWIKFADPLVDGSKFSFGEGAAEIHLPEEDSLITVGDSMDPIISDYEGAIEGIERTAEDLNDKLLRNIAIDMRRHHLERFDPRASHNPRNMANSSQLYHHLQASQFPHQMNQRGPYGNPQMKNHHPFPTDVIPRHGFSVPGGSRFDHQPIPIPLNYLPNHPGQDFPRGVPMPHQINRMPGYISEMSNVHNFPLHHGQPNFGAFGMGMPGVRGGHPEALERLIEMEMRANPKQFHPAGSAAHMYGPEHDMSFRYR